MVYYCIPKNGEMMKPNLFEPNFSLDELSITPLREQLVQQVKNSVTYLRPLPGTKIISERKVALNCQINRKTVHQAYEQLIADGILEEGQGRSLCVSQKARTLCRHPFASICLVLPSSFHQYLQTTQLSKLGYISGVMDRAAQLGVSVYIATLPAIDSPEKMVEEWIDSLVLRNIGIVDLGPRIFSKDVVWEKMLSCPLPHVMITQISNLPNLSSIIVDYEDSFNDCLDTLKALKHKNLVTISSPSKPRKVKYCSEDRVAIFEMMARKQKFNVHSIICDSKEEEIDNVINNLLKSKISFSAIVCENDYMALMVEKALQKRNYKVPEDFSIIGYDRIEPYDFAGFDHSRFDLAAIAVDLIVDLDKNGKAQEKRTKTVKSKFYKGRSLDKNLSSK